MESTPPAGRVAELGSLGGAADPCRPARPRPEEIGPHYLSPEAADQLAYEYFLANWRGPQAKRFRPVRLAELPQRHLIYYQVQPIEPHAVTDEDGVFLGSGGFFVSLDNGDVNDVGSGTLMLAIGYLRKCGRLLGEIEPDPQSLADILARYSGDQLARMLGLK